MGKIKEKLVDFKERLRDRKMLTIVVSLISIILVLVVVVYIKQREYRNLAENGYNNAFYQLVEYVNQTEVMIGKAMVSNNAKHGAETLTNVWRNASLAQRYLARLPITTRRIRKHTKIFKSSFRL